MTLRKAKELSQKHWEMRVRYLREKKRHPTDKEILEEMPELKSVFAFCGLCHYYIVETGKGCSSCRLAKKLGHDCLKSDSYYRKANPLMSGHTEALKYAEKLLEAIKSIKVRGGQS